MRILVSNDDGVVARGIKTIANALYKAGHEVTVVAPSGNRSGFSHSLTVRRPMKLNRNCEGYNQGINVYSLDGTPADCVKFGCYFLRDKNFEIVVSGINDGPNLGVDTMYSGTVGAGMEGLNQGKKAVAVSLAGHYSPTNFEATAKIVVDNLEKLASFSDRVLFNINCPDLPFEQIKGVVWTRIGEIFYDDSYSLSEESEGDDECYILGGAPKEKQSEDIGTDCGAVNCGYASITPLKIDRTCYDVLGKLAK